MKVLIVDDQKRTRRSLKMLLDTLLYQAEVGEAGDGQEAIRLIPEFRPDLVVMDARMPLLDGVQATEWIKANWPEIKVVLLSMYPEYQQAANRIGADAFVSKGEPPEKLLNTILAVLGLM